jgi:DNA modification methylase
MKPVALVERAIRNSSNARDIVLDTFAGSGTTMIASEKSGRQARVLEIDPRYCDVIIRRWQDFTGQQARHGESGRAFNDVAAGVTHAEARDGIERSRSAA